MDGSVEVIHFVDGETSSAGIATVRLAGDFVGLGLSLETDGDVEVFVEAAVCYKLIKALEETLRAMIQSGEN